MIGLPVLVLGKLVLSKFPSKRVLPTLAVLAVIYNFSDLFTIFYDDMNNICPAFALFNSINIIIWELRF